MSLAASERAGAGYRLLVFDWDGTLVDSERRIVSCVRGAIEAVGAPARSDEEIRDIIGLGLREAVRALYPDGDEAFLRALVGAYRERYLAEGAEPTRPFPGVAEVLETLHGHGYRLAVATGKSRAGLERCFRETGLGRWFHASRCADEAGSKPHPRMLKELMAAVDAAPQETLMIGDTVYDLEMARRAGADALGVTWGVHAAWRLEALEPAGLLADLQALPEWLDAAQGRAGLAR